jgi:hypothetical protein
MGAFYTGFADLMADDQGTWADLDGTVDGAMPNWVPVYGAGTFPGSGAPNWQTALPSIVHAVWKYHGDGGIVRRFWPRLRRYLGW